MSVIGVISLVQLLRRQKHRSICIGYVWNIPLLIMLCCSAVFISACSINDSSITHHSGVISSPVVTGSRANANDIQKYDFYTIRYGDSLQKIASKFGVTKEDVIKVNGLSSSYIPKVGQKLRIAVPTAVQEQVALALRQHTLIWPASGKVVRAFAATNKGGSKGIDITGALGQEIRVCMDGKVVYAGSNLAGYGKTVIVKHNDNIVTVYALNKSILVKEGQVVKAGESVATMGNNAQGDVVLHFEVRVNGKPRNPLLYLEKKGIN